MNIIKKYENIPLSNFDLLKLANNEANLILYSQLKNVNNIQEILGDYRACFILFEIKKGYGHWCLLFELPDGSLEFFNPYGGYPDDSLDYIDTDFRKKSNQYHSYLSELLYKSDYILTYNEYAFQKHKDNIKTCGRWCAVRLLFRKLSLLDFYELFKKDGDAKVTELTLWINK